MLLALFGLNGFAGTITFGELGLTNSVQYLTPFDGGDFTVTFAGGTNDGKYYDTGAGIRVYGNGTMTIASKDGSPIKSIVFNFSGGDNYRPSSASVANVGTYDVTSTTWTGSASSVVFTRPSGSGHWRVAAITVSFEGGSEVIPDDPTPDVTTVANIAAFKALADGTEANLTLKDAEVLYVNGSNDMYVRDASGAIDFYKSGLTFTAGQKLNGSVIGKYSLYQGTPEFAATSNTSSSKITAADGTATAKTVGIDDVASYICDLVKLSNVDVTKDGNNYYAVSPTGARVQIYDKFKIGVTPEDGKTYTIEGIIIPYRDAYEICPISDYTKATTEPDEPVDPQPTGKRTYKKATTVESGKAYLIVAEGKAAQPVAATKSYDYLQVIDVEDVNGIIEMDDESSDFVFTATDGGYTILQSDGRYVYQTGSFNSFNVTADPKDGHVWTVTANGDGTFKILNNSVNKWLQYSTSFKSYGSYAKEQGVMPALYVYDPDGGAVTPDTPTEVVVTFDATKDMSEEGQGEFSLTKDGVTMSTTYGMLGDGKAYRYYKGSTLTFKAAGGTITKIEFTSTANATSSNGLGGIEVPAVGTWTVDGKTAVWTGSASTVEFTMGSQVRATLVNVTYTAGEGAVAAGGGSQLSKYPYAKPELIAQARDLQEKAADGDEAAAEQLAELMKDVARSHSHAEGISEAEDLTSLITGDWTKEVFTDGEGIEGEGYFTASGKDIEARVYQTVQLKAGRYMLTATGRGQKYQTLADNIDERLQVMAINNDRLGRYQSITRNDREDGVYGEGWDDASDYFTMTADGEAVIGARFVPKANTESFGEVGNFRLVRLGDAMLYLDAEDNFYNDNAQDLGVVLHRALKADEWNSIVLPFNVSAAQLEEKFGAGAQVAQYDSGKDGVANFKTDKKNNQIKANVPVLLKPTEVSKSNLYVFDHVVMNTSIPQNVTKGQFTFTGYYNPTQTPVEGGYGFDLVVRKDVWTALTTTAVLMPVADAEVLAVTVDGETVFSMIDESADARLNVVGATVQTDEPADEPEEDQTVTGIESVNADSQQGAVYNVAGQRVERPVKGLYIVRGKKVVLK